MKVVQLEQGSEAWLFWRMGGIGASEAAWVLNVGHGTAHELWRIKTLRDRPKPPNAAMLRGIRLEPLARHEYELYTGNLVSPLCVESEAHFFARASLDGITACARLILEIKVPGREDHELALRNVVPYPYWVQIQHQLVCVPTAELAHYWSFDGDTGVGALVEVKRDPSFQAFLMERENTLWSCVMENREPVPDRWVERASRWRAAKAFLEHAKALEAIAREDLLKLVPKTDPRIEGGGVLVSRSNRAGSVNNSEVFKHYGISELDLERFRGKPSVSYAVREKST